MTPFPNPPQIVTIWGLGQYSIFIIMFMKIWFIAKFFSIWWLYIFLGITFCFPWSYYISPFAWLFKYHHFIPSFPPEVKPVSTLYSLLSALSWHWWISRPVALPGFWLCIWVFPWSSSCVFIPQVVLVAKNPPPNAGDAGSISGSGRSPWEGHGNPLQYSCLENPMDRVRHDWASEHSPTVDPMQSFLGQGTGRWTVWNHLYLLLHGIEQRSGDHMWEL